VFNIGQPAGQGAVAATRARTSLDGEILDHGRHYEPGDLFVQMTDGLTGVFDAADQQLGLEPLKEAIRRGARLPLGDVLDALVRYS
jgi:serine phosphatase RsbU (regulator of sigma subunit)